MQATADAESIAESTADAESMAVGTQQEETVAPLQAPELEAIAEPAPTPEQELRSLAAEGAFTKLMERLEQGIDSSTGDKELREMLFGSWKLLAASDSNEVVTGPNGKWQRGLGHTQTFRKPDPMDVFEGGDKLFFMTTEEVVADVKAGKSKL